MWYTRAMHMRHSFRATRAFTLIEMVVVIAIIGLMIGIILPSLLPAKAKSRDAKRVSDLAQIQLALEQYFNRCSTYPSVLAVNNPTGPTGDCYADSTSNITLGTFISSIPLPPAGVQSESIYDYLPSTGGTSGATDYILHVRLENPVTQPYSGMTDTQRGAFVSANNLTMPKWDSPTNAGVCYVNTTTNVKDYCIGPK